jgi:large subunit ribosomal protein L9
MEVVLRQDVESLGLRGDVVTVSRGYARNYLLPRRLAELATPGLLRELERRDAIRARHEANTVDDARAIAARLDALELRFDANAGPTGSLFGSVSATDVADRLWEQEKIRIDRRKLQVGTIKRVGRYTVPVEVFTDVTAELRLVVAPEGQEPPEESAEPEEPGATEAEAAGETTDEVETAAVEDSKPAAVEDEAVAVEEAAEETPAAVEPTAVAADDDADEADEPDAEDGAERTAEPA